MQILKITEAVCAAARRLLQDRELKLHREDRDALANIAKGKRKQVNVHWWTEICKAGDRSRFEKIARLADPSRNPNAHERAAAEAKLKAFKGRRAPGLPPGGRPLPDYDEMMRRFAERKPTKPAPQPPPKQDGGVKHGGVKQKAHQSDGGGVKQKPKRTGDRHREPNKDRHKPGYMREYMRDYQRQQRAKTAASKDK